MLILEHTVEDEKLLAAAVHMGWETARRRVADDAGGASHLSPDPVEHAAVNTCCRRCDPGEVCRMDCGAPGEISIELHQILPLRLDVSEMGAAGMDDDGGCDPQAKLAAIVLSERSLTLADAILAA